MILKDALHSRVVFLEGSGLVDARRRAGKLWAVLRRDTLSVEVTECDQLVPARDVVKKMVEPGPDGFSCIQKFVYRGRSAGAGGPAMLVYADEGDGRLGGDSGVKKPAWHCMI